jgi:uncharacterized protein
MLCPNCRVALTMSERLGVEIDYCPTCRGVWLDRGELDKILARAEPSLSRTSDESGRFASTPERPYPRDGHHGGREPEFSGYRRGKKSWLKEIFD